MNKKLLILDLDETLIFATEQVLGRSENFRVPPYFVYKRPGVDRFTAFALKHFRVAVWTSSTSPYAARVIEQIFGSAYPLDFVWARDRCTRVWDPMCWW